MARAVEQHWPGPLSGLVVTRYGHAVRCERIQIVEAAHPVPDAAGEQAAQRMLDLVQGLAVLIAEGFFTGFKVRAQPGQLIGHAFSVVE